MWTILKFKLPGRKFNLVCPSEVATKMTKRVKQKTGASLFDTIEIKQALLIPQNSLRASGKAFKITFSELERTLSFAPEHWKEILEILATPTSQWNGWNIYQFQNYLLVLEEVFATKLLADLEKNEQLQTEYEKAYALIASGQILFGSTVEE